MSQRFRETHALWNCEYYIDHCVKGCHEQGAKEVKVPKMIQETQLATLLYWHH